MTMVKRLTFVQIGLLHNWTLHNAETVKNDLDKNAAASASKALDFKVTPTNIKTMRMQLGWSKRTVSKPGSANRDKQSTLERLENLEKRLAHIEDWCNVINADTSVILSKNPKTINARLELLKNGMMQKDVQQQQELIAHIREGASHE